MRARGADLLRAFDPMDAHYPKTTFSTKEESHTGDLYFLQSADAIGFFLEEGALDKDSGRLAVPAELAVNKIGHGPFITF